MGSLFSTKTSTSNKSTESGTANTSNNIWDTPGLQDFYSQYQQQYSPGNISSVNAPVNSYQTGAAGNQGQLSPIATGVANQGISNTDIQRFMDPYVQSVVNPTLQAQNIQNQQGLSNLGGNQALKGALGNNTGAGAAYLAGVQPAQQAQIASLYSQGYGQAANLAGQSAQTQLAGVNAANTANQGQFNMGETIRQAGLQNQLTPYSLYAQGIEGFGGLGNLAGTNTATSGTSSGSGSSTSTPGAGTVGLGILGALASFSDERVKDNIKPIGATFDGQPIYKYNLKGSPKTEIGLMAQDVEQRDPGAVGSMAGIKTVDYDRATKGAERASGGGVDGGDDFHGKVMKAFHMIQGMKAHARGGAIHRDMGGQTPLQKAGAGLTDFSKQLSQPAPVDTGLGESQSGLSSMLSGAASATRPMRPFGGSINAPSGATPGATGPSAMQKFGSSLTDLSKGLSEAPPADTGLGQAQSGLSQMLAGAAAATRPMRPFGGSVPALADGGDPSWGSRAWDALSGFFHVPESVKGGLEAYPAAAKIVGANPEGVARGLAHGVMNAFPMGSVADLAYSTPEAIRGMAAFGQPSAAAEPVSAGSQSASASEPTESPYGGRLYEDTDFNFAPPAMSDAAPSMMENSSITPGREVLPWKVGAGDIPPPPAAPPTKSSSWRDYLPSVLSDGVWVGQPATPMQRFGAALMQVGQDNPFAKAGQMIAGYPKDAAESAYMKAKTINEQHEGDLEWQRKAMLQKAEIQREADMAQKNNVIAMIRALKTRGVTADKLQDLFYFTPSGVADSGSEADDAAPAEAP